MDGNNNSLKAIENLNLLQARIKKLVVPILLTSLGLAGIILILGLILSLYKVPMPKTMVEKGQLTSLAEGSIKYTNDKNPVILNETYFDDRIAQIIPALIYDVDIWNSINDGINSAIKGKTVIYITEPEPFNHPKTESVLNALSSRNKTRRDSLSNILRVRPFLDSSGTGLLNKLNLADKNISALQIGLKNIKFSFVGDYPVNAAGYTFHIGKFIMLTGSANNPFKIHCSQTAPVTSAAFLASSGVSTAYINEATLLKQSQALSQFIVSEEAKLNAQNKKEENKIRENVKEQRAQYRLGFYNRWYPSLIITLNSLIFFILLLRYWIIIRQSELPRKSTDFIYYATNRTSRFFRLIALILIVVGMFKLVTGSILDIIGLSGVLPSFINIPVDNRFVFSLLDPPTTFVSTILITWFLILSSEWIDFISNCYDVLFAKAHHKNDLKRD